MIITKFTFFAITKTIMLIIILPIITMPLIIKSIAIITIATTMITITALQLITKNLDCPWILESFFLFFSGLSSKYEQQNINLVLFLNFRFVSLNVDSDCVEKAST